jgi:hypothetical protein
MLTLQLTQTGRALRSDPQRLLGEVATAIAADIPGKLDLALARLLIDDPSEIEWNLLGLLMPINGIQRPSQHAIRIKTPFKVIVESKYDFDIRVAAAISARVSFDQEIRERSRSY